MRQFAASVCCIGWLFFGATCSSAIAETGTAIEVGFSPDGSAEKLVLRSIHSAHKSIRLAAYSFTAAPVVQALVNAKKSGVDVAVLVDFKSNLKDDRSGKARAALGVLVNAGKNNADARSTSR